jgi:hypothetical protein
MSNARFSILQARAVKDTKISDSQFRTLAALGMYADKEGWCYPSLTTLGVDLGKSKQAVGRDTIALRKMGYLEVKHRYDKKTKARHSNLYRLVFDFPINQPDVDGVSTSDVDINALPNDPKNGKPVSNSQKVKPAKRDSDGFLGLNIEQAQRMAAAEQILCALERGLKINIARDDKAAKKAALIVRDGRSVDTWITWYRSDQFRLGNMPYMNIDKVWSMWPQAFDTADGFVLCEGITA